MKIELRPWQTGDERFLLHLANDREIARWLRDVFPHPYTPQDARKFVSFCLDSDENKDLCRVIQADGRAVGAIALTRGCDVGRRSAELGYWLGRRFHGKGIMTDAVRQMCLLGFERWEIVRIFAQPFAENRASRRVLEKAGFSFEGLLRQSIWKWGKLQDSCVYALLREELDVSQSGSNL